MPNVQNDQDLLLIANSGVLPNVRNDQELFLLANALTLPNAKVDQNLLLVAEQRLNPAIDSTQVDQELFLLIGGASSVITLTGGKFQDNEGNPLSYGYLTFKLNADTYVTANPFGQIVSGITTLVQLDKQGSIVGTDTFGISTVQINNNVLIVQSNVNLSTVISIGDEIVFPSSLAASFLDNAIVIVTSVSLVGSTWQFTANFTNTNYGPTAESAKSATIGIPPVIWSNAELTPSGTAYFVNLFNVAGTRVWQNQKTVIFTQSSGSTVNISNVAFTNSANPPTYPGAVILDPTADQSIIAFSLLPANGNSTQSLGDSAAQWNGYFNDVTIAATLADSTLSVGTNGQVLSSTGTGIKWTTQSVLFNNIGSGTNTTATMLVGSGGNISPTGSGVVNANEITSVSITNTPSTGGLTLTSVSSSTAQWSNVATGFNAVSSGTNTTAAMVVGSGASLATSGTGTINANEVEGITVTGTPAAGNVLTATSSSAATWGNGGFILPSAGLRLQFGGPVGAGTTNFPVAFSSTPAVVLGNITGSVNMNSGSITATGFALSVSSGSTAYWIAIGPA